MRPKNDFNRTLLIMDIVRQLEESIKQFHTIRTSTSDNRANACSGKSLAKVEQTIIDYIKQKCDDDPDIKYYTGRKASLPGHFRSNKDWDIVIKQYGELKCAIELKSMLSSFGNNFNNRLEECLGCGYDLKKSYESYKKEYPMICYLIFIPDNKESRKLRSDGESYITKFKELCQKVVQDNLYRQALVVTYTVDDTHDSTITFDSQNIKSFLDNIIGYITKNEIPEHRQEIIQKSQTSLDKFVKKCPKT